MTIRLCNGLYAFIFTFGLAEETFGPSFITADVTRAYLADSIFICYLAYEKNDFASDEQTQARDSDSDRRPFQLIQKY